MSPSLLFLTTPPFTGATRVTRTIAKKLSARYKVSFATIENLRDPQREIHLAIDCVQPAVLFCSFTSINPDVIVAGKERDLRVIVRNDYNLRDLSIETKQRILETYPQADWIIAQTEEMRQELLANEALRDCRIKVIENPLDEEDILQKAASPNPFEDNGNFHFLWVGREDPIKDLPTLRRAFEFVHEQYPNTDLTLVSNDPNPFRWMKYADCLVISSISEASPNVLREALFLGTKVLSTDCSPIVKKLLPKNHIARIGDSKALAEVMLNVM